MDKTVWVLFSSAPISATDSRLRVELTALFESFPSRDDINRVNIPAPTKENLLKHHSWSVDTNGSVIFYDLEERVLN